MWVVKKPVSGTLKSRAGYKAKAWLYLDMACGMSRTFSVMGQVYTVNIFQDSCYIVSLMSCPSCSLGLRYPQDKTSRSWIDPLVWLPCPSIPVKSLHQFCMPKRMMLSVKPFSERTLPIHIWVSLSLSVSSIYCREVTALLPALASCCALSTLLSPSHVTVLSLLFCTSSLAASSLHHGAGGNVRASAHLLSAACCVLTAPLPPQPLLPLVVPQDIMPQKLSPLNCSWCSLRISTWQILAAVYPSDPWVWESGEAGEGKRDGECRLCPLAGCICWLQGRRLLRKSFSQCQSQVLDGCVDSSQSFPRKIS